MPKLQLPHSPAADHLQVRTIDGGAGAISGFRFVTRPEFLNGNGVVHGGFLAAMLDEAIGHYLAAISDNAELPSTADLHVQFLRPGPPGEYECTVSIARQGRTTVFCDANLIHEEVGLCSRAIATCKVKAGVSE